MSAPARDASPSPAALLARAAASAGSGRYHEARLALETLGGAGSTDPAVLDLLARIHAQQGEFAQADACWARVQDADPPSAGLAAAAVGRGRITVLQAGAHRPPARRRLASAALVLAAAGAVTAGVLLPRPAPARPDPGLGRQLAAVRGGQERIAGQLGRLRSQLDGVTRDARPSPVRIAAALAGPGTTVTEQGGSLLVTFDDGLFAGDATPTPEGRAALAALAGRIRSAAPAGPLVVTGHTDDTPLTRPGRYADRVTLGFARAEVAAEALAVAAGIPLTAIGIRSTGTAEPPFPDDSAADRARNETVTVLVGLG